MNRRDRRGERGEERGEERFGCTFGPPDKIGVGAFCSDFFFFDFFFALFFAFWRLLTSFAPLQLYVPLPSHSTVCAP